MKKTLAMLLAVAILIVSSLSASAVQINIPEVSSSDYTYVKGDVDYDDHVTSYDALATLRYTVNLEDFNKKQINAADMNNDGNVTPVDAFYILRKSVNLDFSETTNMFPYYVNSDPSIIYNCANNKQYHKGDTVEIQYCLRNIKILGSFGTNLYYNPEYIKPDDTYATSRGYNNFFKIEKKFEYSMIQCHYNDPGVIWISNIGKPDGTSLDPYELTPVITIAFTALKDFKVDDLGIYDETYESSETINKSDTVNLYVSYSDVSTLKIGIQAYGDIDYNKISTPYDSWLVLRQSVGLENFTEIQKRSADVDNDSKITSADALAILRYSVGYDDSSTKFDSERFEDNINNANSAVYYNCDIGDTYHKGDTVTVAYKLGDVPHIGSVGANIYYDPSYIQFVSSEKSNNALTVVSNTSKPGIIKVGSTFNAKGNTNDFENDSATLITFTFKALKTFYVTNLNICTNTYELSSISDDDNSTKLLVNKIGKKSTTESYSETVVAIDKNTNYQEDSDTDIKKDSDTDKDTDTENPDKNSYKTIGDLDDDGRITSLDSLLILRNSVKLEEFTEKQNKIADVDGDGKITSADALEVLRNSVGFKSYNIGDTIKK